MHARLLDAVHTPIGLKIGAETPEEIAVSVDGGDHPGEEMPGSGEDGKAAGCRAGGYSAELLEALLDPADQRRKSSGDDHFPGRGSAPRSVGTKDC